MKTKYKVKTLNSTKLLIYNEIIKHVWRRGIEIWDCTNKTNPQSIQTELNKNTR